ncbi:MAG TPA: PAS domain S-box protein [Candidatus Eremiobacteraceae bacterium]|nr:PAS domain S-box protein [Candidatus Eremiobacteraceae bacterium]
MEQALQHETSKPGHDFEARVNALTRVALDAVVMMDPEGRITDWNPQAEITFGWSREEAMGRLLSHTIIPLRYQEAHTRGFRRFLETGGKGVPNKRMEIEAVHRDGREFPVDLAISAVHSGGASTFVAFVRDTSARKRVEEALAEETEALYSLMDSTQDSIYFKDVAGRFTRINRAHAQALGISNPLQALGKTDADFFDRDFAQAAQADEQQMMQSGTSLIGKVECVRPNGGTEIWYSTTKVVLKDSQQRVAGILGVSRDITQLNRVQEELRTNEQELRKARDELEIKVAKRTSELRRSAQGLQRSEFYLAEGQRLGHTGSWALNPSGFFEYWSRELFQIYGLDPQKGAPTLDQYLATIHRQDRDFMAETVKRMCEQGSGCDVKKRIIRPDGAVRYVRCVGIPVLDNGVLKRFLGTAMDVTEQEQLTQELQRREAYLAEAQRLSHTGSFGWKPDSGEIVWSEETYRVFEYEHAVKPTIDLLVQRVHPEDRPAFLKVVESASAGATQFEHTYRWLLPDGSVKHIHAVAHALQDASGSREFVGAATDITSIKRAEEELRTSEAYLAEAQRLSHTGSWAWNPVTDDIRYWSEECYCVLGFDPLGPPPRFETFFQRLHPADRAPVREQFEKAIRDKADFEFGYRIVHPDKGVRDIHVVGHAVLDRSGELHEFVGTVIDITERKAAEEALRSSEGYLSEAQRLSHTGSWAWSPDTDVRYWSEECYRVLGFDPRDGLPRIEELIQRIHPDDQPAFRESAKRTNHNKLDVEVDYRIVHPGGAVRDIHSIGHPVFSPCGDVIEYTGTVIDITERKRAEQELQQLVDLVPQIIVVFDSDGKVIHANRVAREYTGLTHEEFRSLDVFGRLIHPDDVEKVGAARKHGFAGSEPFELDARVLGKDGIHRWFLGRYNPLVEEGRVRRWYVSATEIESRKQEEERVRQENVRLEERTRIAQELHDTLLQSVLSASMQLGVTVDGVPSDSHVKVRLDRILQLMQQGIEDGRKALQGLRLSDTAPLDLVQAFSGIQRELAVPSDVEFRVTVIGEKRPLPLAIQHEIYRIGREALINAFRHSRATRVEVELEYADSELRMRIRDNGCGVGPRVLETGREGHWGLAGMRERATRLGGLLKVFSSATGTEIELSLPLM